MEIKNENKKSKLCFDAKIVRKLLKMNDEIRYCPYCGKEMSENCGCHKNIIVDIKPYRNENKTFEKDRSVFVFSNNEAFQSDYNQLMEEVTAKNIDAEPEQLTMDLD